MSTVHIVHGKPTVHGHVVHYRDHDGTTHAAIITNLTATPSTGEYHADLHVFDRVDGEGRPFLHVPYGSEGGELNSWQHLPY